MTSSLEPDTSAVPLVWPNDWSDTDRWPDCLGEAELRFANAHQAADDDGGEAEVVNNPDHHLASRPSSFQTPPALNMAPSMTCEPSWGLSQAHFA